MENVCTHFNVTTAAVNGKSRKRDYVVARQVAMYLAQKHTKMPASRIGKLIGGRDHSTVIYSCSQIEKRMKRRPRLRRRHREHRDIVQAETLTVPHAFRLHETHPQENDTGNQAGHRPSLPGTPHQKVRLALRHKL